MKAVVVLLVALAAVASAQLQYEQAAYTDNAAPVDTPMMEEADVAESSFAQVQDNAEADGPFSDIAHAQSKAINSVRSLFNKKKDAGGNISPSRPTRKGWKSSKPRRPRAAVKGSVASKRAAAMNASSSSSKLTRAIIDPKKGKGKAGKKSSKKAKKAKKTRRARMALKKLLSKKRSGKGKKRIAFPKPPAAAKGDHLWHYERFPPTGPNGKMMDPEEAKLNLALEAVKEDILSTNKQINDERRWVIAVGKIIKSYNKKMQRVEAHIIALRKEMKALYRKKKQIENLKLQRALQAKLKEAKAELKTLRNSLSHVARKQGELNRSGLDLRRTIAGIHAQLAKLRGKRVVRRCRAGTRYSRKSKKCKSICKAGAVFSRKAKKCVARCRKGLKWNARARKCVAKKGKGRKGRKGARRGAKRGARRN